MVHRLYRSGPEADARRALLVAFPPGAHWPGVDVQGGELFVHYPEG